MSVTFDDPNALLLAAEVAEHRRTTTGKLAVERHRGTGPRLIRDGRRVLYKAGDLAEWLAAHTVTPRSPAA